MKLDGLDFSNLFTQYAEQLVVDATRMLSHKTGGYRYPEMYCREALIILTTGQAGEDIFIDAAARLAGIEPAEIYRQLLAQAKVRAARNLPRPSQRIKVNSEYELRERRNERGRDYRERTKELKAKHAS